MIKPNIQSEEILDEYTVRLCPPWWMQQAIEASDDTLEIGIDRADATLLRRTSGGRIKKVVYNAATTNFEYKYYNDANLGVVVGFMPYGAKNWWLYYYKDENSLIQLTDIKTPAALPKPSPIKDSVTTIMDFIQQ